MSDSFTFISSRFQIMRAGAALVIHIPDRAGSRVVRMEETARASLALRSDAPLRQGRFAIAVNQTLDRKPRRFARQPVEGVEQPLAPRVNRIVRLEQP